MFLPFPGHKISVDIHVSIASEDGSRTREPCWWPTINVLIYRDRWCVSRSQNRQQQALKSFLRLPEKWTISRFTFAFISRDEPRRLSIAIANNECGIGTRKRRFLGGFDLYRADIFRRSQCFLIRGFSACSPRG